MSKKKTEKEFEDLFNGSNEKYEPKDYREKVQRLLEDINGNIRIQELIYNDMKTETNNDLIKGVMLGRKMLIKEILHEFQIRQL